MDLLRVHLNKGFYPAVKFWIGEDFMSISGEYLNKCRELIEIVEAQEEAIGKAADWFADVTDFQIPLSNVEYAPASPTTE